MKEFISIDNGDEVIFIRFSAVVAVMENFCAAEECTVYVNGLSDAVVIQQSAKDFIESLQNK